MDESASLGAAPPLRTLIPYDGEECISIGDAQAFAHRTDRTIRNWCVRYGIGRRIPSGRWAISRVALQMLLDGDHQALAAYRDDGVRGAWEPVAKYYHRCGLAHLLERPGF